jgi:hypothetical protein
MSIVACVKVYDGIALGADSATQITGRDPHGNINVLKVYQNATKIFQFQDAPVGILTYGIGNIGEKSIETLLREYNINHKIEAGNFSSNDKQYTVQNISQGLLQYFRGLYEQQFTAIPQEQKPILGLYIAGYSENESLGEEFEFVIPKDGTHKVVRPPGQFGASWRGISVPFSRLYFGIDPRVEERFTQMGRQDVIPIINQLKNEFSSKVIYNGMPIFDAIKFVEFILLTTIKLAYFEIGAPSCSEPIDLAVIKDGKFTWKQKKELKEQ